MGPSKLTSIVTHLEKRDIVLFDVTSRTVDSILSICHSADFKPVINNSSDHKQLISFLNDQKERLIIIESSQGPELDETLYWIEKNRFKISSTVIIVLKYSVYLQVLSVVNRGIDGVLTHPITMRNFVTNINSSINAASFRKNFAQITKTSKQILQTTPDEAEEYINQRLKLSQQPYLAKCILAEFYLEQSEYTQSFYYFTESLKAKPNNLRALLGIKDLLIATDFEDKAYQVLKKIFSLYPAHPKHIFEAFRLCITSLNYQDMESLITLYFVFRDLDKRYDQYAAAAIYIRATQLIKSQDFYQLTFAVKQLQELEVNLTTYLLPLIEKLVLIKEAATIKTLLGFFNTTEQKQRSYDYAQYLYLKLTGTDLEVFEAARSLFGRGYHEPNLVEEIIVLAKKLKRTDIIREFSSIQNQKKAG